MSDDRLPELEIVPRLSVEEERRRFVFELGIKYIPGDELAPPILESLQALSLMERWLINGEVAEKPDKRVSKFSVVKPDGGTDERR